MSTRQQRIADLLFGGQFFFVLWSTRKPTHPDDDVCSRSQRKLAALLAHLLGDQSPSRPTGGQGSDKSRHATNGLELPPVSRDGAVFPYSDVLGRHGPLE